MRGRVGLELYMEETNTATLVINLDRAYSGQDAHLSHLGSKVIAVCATVTDGSHLGEV